MEKETIEAIEKEANENLIVAGRLGYMIQIQKAQLAQINQKILELNQKAHAIQNPPPAEASKAKAPAATV